MAQGVRYNKSQKAAPMDVRGLDLYETPEIVTQSLLKHVSLPKHIWEPCYGLGAIARVLEANGHKVYGSDLVDYGGNGIITKDFFNFKQSIASNSLSYDDLCIVTNPPFGRKIPQKFVKHALTMVPKVILLLRLAFLEGNSKERCEVLDSGYLHRVYLFKNRTPRMHRFGFKGPKATNTVAFGWFEWDNRYTSKNIAIERIECK